MYRKFCHATCLQYSLLAVLLITLVFNVMFVLDNRSRFQESQDQFAKQQARDHPKDISPHRENNAEGFVGHKKALEPPRKIRIEAKSSKSSVYVAIDGLKVYEDSSEGDKTRGIHIVVINEFSGVIMAKRTFDTYLAKEEEAMVLFLNLITEGRIVIFTIKDEGTMNLKKVGRNALKTYGSRFAEELSWRSTWAYISRKRNMWYAEAIQKSPSFNDWAAPVVVQATVQLLAQSAGCDWGNDDVARRRRNFCSKYEGYGSVCSCTNPAPINLRGDPLTNNNIASLPIAVIAANRPNYLFRMLRGLLSKPGVDPSNVIVYIDGFFDEPSAIAELFKVSVVEHVPICSKNCRISQHYKRSLKETFEKYPAADYMIILEEDLDVSKDLMDYFSQLIPVLATDQSLYCISAWNDQGYEHSSNDPSMLYRVETMPGLGWVLKKSLFMNELYPKWPGSDKFWDWDMWMRMDGNRKGRECIIPDVSRTYHFGAKGLNMNSYFQDLYFTKHALNTKSGIHFNISRVEKDSYEQHINDKIRTAEVLDHKENPCSSDRFIPDTKGRTYIFYIHQTHTGDYETWTNVARCFKLWDLDVRGFHKQMWRFWMKENQIFVVGSSSPYIHYKPDNVKPIFLPKKKKE
ncbi:protein O-linked-mannose beta-1,2-N-acetylglucosaminyltransferase 1-like [Clytia hemisphaerica]|uniref:Protein O-linked-mannose beta-1,2-N-acetylglucosaminyltransferase n=1 Tax=Clytia hemisphaerica TaxID=252671 RepID=A0A7M5V850_9CNID|eukprot:TCONS_00003508-protein